MTYKIFVTDYFEKKLRRLTRKYRRLADDYQEFLDNLELNPFTGDRLQGCLGPVLKARMACRDMQKGKSGGIRIIYLIKSHSMQIFLLTLYPKGERESIDISEVNAILKKEGLID